MLVILQEDQIAVLYVCGFASSVIFGAWAPFAADRYGRKKLCLSFTVIYSIACVCKLTRNYGLLALGRILGGVATSLLFSAFEAWYVHEHVETHDFPKEWIPVTFSKAAVWNGALAVGAGVLANVVAEWLRFGPVSPFVLAIPCLVGAGIVVCATWQENYSKTPLKFGPSCMQGLRSIGTEPRIFLIGVLQSCFESAMYIFIFLWTPVLAPAEPSFGIIFSSFMVCITIGTTLFQLLVSRRVPVITLLAISIVTALLGFIICIPSTMKHDSKTLQSYTITFLAFLGIEVAVGMYFPCMAHLRTKVITEADRRSVGNWFRVPMNLIACSALMYLHNQSFHQGNAILFIVCTCLLALAALCAVAFHQLTRDDDEFQAEVVSSEDSPVEVWGDLKPYALNLCLFATHYWLIGPWEIWMKF